MDPDSKQAMSCDQIQRQISESLDAEAPAQHSAAVREHLGRCGDCREYAEQLQDMRQGLQSLPVVALPEQTVDSILAETTGRTQGLPFIGVHRKLIAGLAVAAALVFAVHRYQQLHVDESDARTQQAVDQVRLALGLASDAVELVQAESIEHVIRRRVPGALEQVFDSMQRATSRQ